MFLWHNYIDLKDIHPEPQPIIPYEIKQACIIFSITWYSWSYSKVSEYVMCVIPMQNLAPSSLPAICFNKVIFLLPEKISGVQSWTKTEYDILFKHTSGGQNSTLLKGNGISGLFWQAAKMLTSLFTYSTEFKFKAIVSNGWKTDLCTKSPLR